MLEMKPEIFSEVCCSIMLGETVTIDGEGISAQQLEEILTACENSGSWGIEFQNTFSYALQQIIINKVIGLTYDGQEMAAMQLCLLADPYVDYLQRRGFDYRVNHSKYLVELQGISLTQLDAVETTVQVTEFVSNLSTAFMHYIAENNHEEVERRLYYGLDLNTVYQGHTPLTLACSYGHQALVELLLKQSTIDVKVTDAAGSTPLWHACQSKHIEIVGLLLKHATIEYCDYNDVTSPSYNPENDYVKLSIKTKDLNFFSEIIKISFGGFLQLSAQRLQELVETSKEFQAQEFVLLLQVIQQYQNNNAVINQAFLFSIKNNYGFLVQEFLDFGIDVNQSMEGQYPLMVAIELQLHHIIKLLLSVEIDVNQVNAAGIAPLTLAMGQGDLVTMQLLLDQKGCQYFKLLDINYPNFIVELSPLHFAIRYNRADILETYLKWEQGNTTVFMLEEAYFIELERAIYHYQTNELLDVLQNLKKESFNRLIELFISVDQNDVYQVTHLLAEGANVNIMYQGRYVLDMAAEKGFQDIFDQVMMAKGNINKKNAYGKTALNYACEQGHEDILGHLIDSRGLIYYEFHQHAYLGYEADLDPMHIGITNNQVSIVELLIRRKHHLNQLQQAEVEAMHAYAITQNSRDVLKFLGRILQGMRSGYDVLSENFRFNENHSLNHHQSISRSDRSIILAIRKLCERFNIGILLNEHEKCCYFDPETIDVDEVYERIGKFIDDCTSCHYKVYDYSHNGRTLELRQYKAYARSMFEKIKSNVSDKYGAAYSRWKFPWCIKPYTTPNRGRYHGIGVKEAYVLAVLAAEDKFALAGKELISEDIKNRQNMIVESLVASERAYNANNDKGIDMGGDSDSSCVHGTFCRSFLTFGNGAHDDIQIMTHPERWAADLAKQVLGKFYLQYPQRATIERLVLLNPFQLSKTEQKEIDNFYREASSVIESILLEEIGLQEQGGHLTSDELSEILKHIQCLELPSAEPHSPDETGQHEIFSKVTTASFRIRAMQLEQRQLACTSHALYVALLLSAKQSGHEIQGIHTILQLRDAVANVLSSIVLGTTEDTKLPIAPGVTYLAKVTQIKKIMTMHCKQLLLQQMGEQASEMTAEELVTQIIFRIRSNQHPDALVLKILSAIYNLPIMIFNQSGEFILEINPVQLFLKVTGSSYLALVQIKSDDTAKTHYNCLLPEGTWQTCHQYAMTLLEEEGSEASQLAETIVPEFSCLSMQRAQFVQTVYQSETGDLEPKISRKRKIKLNL